MFAFLKETIVLTSCRKNQVTDTEAGSVFLLKCERRFFVVVVVVVAVVVAVVFVVVVVVVVVVAVVVLDGFI